MVVGENASLGRGGQPFCYFRAACGAVVHHGDSLVGCFEHTCCAVREEQEVHAASQGYLLLFLYGDCGCFEYHFFLGTCMCVVGGVAVRGGGGPRRRRCCIWECLG